MKANNISAYPTVLVDGKEVDASRAAIFSAVGLGQDGGAGCPPPDDELDDSSCGDDHRMIKFEKD